MPHTLLATAISTFVLCGPALADSAAPPAPLQPLRLTVAVKAGADVRTHELAISDGGCGTISDKTTAYEDQIRICSKPTPTGVLLDADWTTRTGPSEYRTRWESLVARGGGTIEVGRAGVNRLVLTVR